MPFPWCLSEEPSPLNGKVWIVFIFLSCCLSTFPINKAVSARVAEMKSVLMVDCEILGFWWLFSALSTPLVETGLKLLTQRIEIASRMSVPRSARALLKRQDVQIPCDVQKGWTHTHTLMSSRERHFQKTWAFVFPC